MQVLGPSASTADMQVVDDEGRPHLDPAVVLVSNNPYSLEPPHTLGTRRTLDSGQLGIIVLDAPQTGHGLGRAWTATRIEVVAPAPVHAGVDGEATDLTPPLEFVIRPGELRVRIPSSHRAAWRAGRLP